MEKDKPVHKFVPRVGLMPHLCELCATTKDNPIHGPIAPFCPNCGQLTSVDHYDYHDNRYSCPTAPAISQTPTTDAYIVEFSPSNDPRYEGPVEWVPASTARILEQSCDQARTALAAAEKERDEANDKALHVVRGQFKQICSYCGWESDEGGWDDLQAHIKVCPEHPVSALSAQLATALKERDDEQGRWQEAIGDLLWKLSGKQVDGAGCDSGDPLDLTLTEIGLSWPEEELTTAHAELARCRDALKRYGFHKPTCDVFCLLMDEGEGDCTCGFAAALTPTQ